MALLDQVYQKAQSKKIPLGIQFDLTYRCHQGCLHCYLPEAWRRGEGPGPELTAPRIKSILPQLATAGAFFLAFSGGEIFLRPDLLTILEEARRLNFSITLITSGTLGLDEDKIRHLAELGLEAVMLSIYSLKPPVHDGITARPGSWEKLWQTINTCRSRGLLVVFNCFALSPNYPGIVALKQFADREGIPFRLDGTLTPRWDGRPHPPGLALPREVMTRLYQETGWDEEEERRQGCPSVTPELEFPDCGAASNTCYFTPQGEIWPCIEVPYPCGHLQPEEEFLTLWEDSPGFREVRQLQRQCPPEEKFCDFCQRVDQKKPNILVQV